ncbi:MAG: hypothetical protein ACK5LG_22185 [Bacteroides thetaiotaomicron]
MSYQSIRQDACDRACEGMGTGELLAIVEGGSTLKTQFEEVVAQREAAIYKANKAREDLQVIREVIKTTCCTALMDKTSVLSGIDAVISELGSN